MSIALEELDLAYQVIPINIARGDQQMPEFLAISPNGRIPAILDLDPADGGPPLSIAESGASGARDMGAVMRIVMPAVRGRADGKQVQQVVRSLLA